MYCDRLIYENNKRNPFYIKEKKLNKDVRLFYANKNKRKTIHNYFIIIIIKNFGNNHKSLIN